MSGKQTKKISALIPLKLRLRNDKIDTLTLSDDGAIAINKIGSDGSFTQSLILHTDVDHRNAIDIEQRICERSDIQDNQISFINVDDLVGKFLPDTSLRYSTRFAGTDSAFVMKIKRFNESRDVNFVSQLKFNTLTPDTVKAKLTSFTQSISKISHFLENDVSQSDNLMWYLRRLSSLTAKEFNNFTATQFQPLMSVARHADEMAFEQFRDRIEFDTIPTIERIKSDIERLKEAKIKERSTYNFKGIKMYMSEKSLSVNLLGYSYTNPKDTIMRLVYAHLMMCGQIDDFKTKLEQQRLLHA